MDALETPRSVPRSAGAAALSALGVFLVAVHAVHVATYDTAVFGILIGGVIPLLLAVALAATGPILYRSRLDALAITTTAAWGYIGALALGCVALLIIGHQTIKGAPLHGPGYMAAATVTGGAIVGTVAGRYDALNRQKAEIIGSLQEATAALSTATTADEVCRRAVEIADEILEIPLAGIWLYDEAEEALVPAAIADPATDLFESPPTYRPGNSLSWAAFESGRIERFDDISGETDRHNSETVIRSEIIVPLGDLGVMNFGSTDAARFSSLDQTVAELLGGATEAALTRADREETLRTQQRLLERQNERLEDFTSVVSHDLRNPLNVAGGRIELEIETGDGTHLEAALDALQDMESLIDDLLALAKQGHTVGDTERVSLAAVAEDARRNVEPDEATFEISDFELDADADRLRQLLENLFRNAVVHAGPEPTVRVGPLPEGAGFFVDDDGPGIDPGNRERIFDIGYTDHEDGTGFGLSIVRRIAAAHEWSIRATTSASGGARFEFRFEDRSHS